MEEEEVAYQPQRTLSTIIYPDERLDLIMERSAVYCTLFGKLGSEGEFNRLAADSVKRESERLGINCEDFKETAKKNIQSIATGLVTKAKGYIHKHSLMLTRLNKLPDNPVIKRGDIELGSWAIGCFKNEEFDLDFALSLLNYESDLKDSIEHIYVIKDNKSESGYAELLDVRKFTRRPVSKGNASTIRILKAKSLDIRGFSNVLVIPGNVVAIVLTNKDGSNKVKWRKVGVPDLKSLDTVTSIPALTEEQYKEVKDKVKKLVSIYSNRIRDYSSAETRLGKVSSNFDTQEEAHATEDSRNLNAALALEDAITVGLKRSIDSLLSYLEHSIER